MAELPPERAIDEVLLPPPEGDWSDMGDYSEHVKVWLPAPAAYAAAKLAHQYHHSTTIIVRNALIIHVYGRLLFDQLVLNGQLRAPRGYHNDIVNPKQLVVAELAALRSGESTDLAREDPVTHRQLVAVDENSAPGPAIVALRVAVPPRLKRDLLALAERAGRPLSEYCRVTLTSYYLGALGKYTLSG